MTRSKSPEEIRQEFICKVRNIVNYWSNLENETPFDRCDGVAFSILNIFDGTTDLPAFNIVVCPHEEDKQYHINNGEDWYENGTVINDCMLHEIYCQ